MARKTDPGGGKGGGSEGGGGSGGGKGGGSSLPSFESYDNNDNYSTITDRTQLVEYGFDGRRGSDTLDMSQLTGGVTVSIGTSSDSILSIEQGAVGNAWWFYGSNNLSGAVEGTISNFENLIGTSGSDLLEVNDFGENYVNGGAGDDILLVRGGVDIVIGGDGNDFLRGYSDSILVGDNWNSDWNSLPTGGGGSDTFENGGAILDFELGVDTLMIEAYPSQQRAFLDGAFYDGKWTDPTGQQHDAAILNDSRGDPFFFLVGISADEANTQIAPNIQFSTIGIEGPAYGGPNDDVLLPAGNADTFLLQDFGGDDLIVYPSTDPYDPSDDTLLFPDSLNFDDPKTDPRILSNWTQSEYNGVDSLVYDYGTGSITIIGLTLDQLGTMSMGVNTVGPNHLLV